MSTRKRCQNGFRKNKSGECVAKDDSKNITRKSKVSLFKDIKFHTNDRRKLTKDMVENKRVDLRCNVYNNRQEEFQFIPNDNNTFIKVYCVAKTPKGRDTLCAKLIMKGLNSIKIENVKAKCTSYTKEEIEKLIRHFSSTTYLDIVD